MRSQAIKRLSLSLLLGLTIWLFLYLLSNSLYEDFKIVPTEDRDLSINLKGKIDLNHQDHYRFELALYGEPQSIGKLTVTKLSFNRLKIFDAKERKIFEFEKKEEGSVHYRSDPRLTNQEREEIFSLFSVDLHDNDLLNDQSLMQQTFEIATDRIGNIHQIDLSKGIRTKIYQLIENRPFAQLIRSAIDHPNNFPSLFKPGRSGDQWKTEGSNFFPLTVSYRVDDRKSGENGYIKIKGKTDTLPERISPLSGAGNNPIFRYTHFTVDYAFNPIQGKIRKLDFSLGFELLRKIYSEEMKNHVALELTVEVDSVPKRKAIKESELFY